jgi:hypothetical protein
MLYGVLCALINQNSENTIWQVPDLVGKNLLLRSRLKWRLMYIYLTFGAVPPVNANGPPRAGLQQHGPRACLCGEELLPDLYLSLSPQQGKSCPAGRGVAGK